MRILCIVLLSLSLFFLSFTDCPAYAQTFDHLILTWNDDPHTTQVINWKTDIKIQHGFVQYIELEKKQQKGTIIQAQTEKFFTNLGPLNLHTVKLSNLQPGTTYLYQVGDGKEWSNPHTFTTEADRTSSFKFLVFGDSQSGNSKNPEYGPWAITCQKAWQANPDAKFFLNLGDLVEVGQDYNHWNYWFTATKGVIDTIPFFPILGNHETYVPNSWENSNPVFWLKQFKLPQNGPESLKNQVYSFNYGNVHFTILDTQEKEERLFNKNILSKQKKWLEKDLSNSTQKWKIVILHKPLYSVSQNRDNKDIRVAFQPILDKYHVDLVLQGHDHYLARTYPINNNHVTINNNKGTIYYIAGRSGNKRSKYLATNTLLAFSYNPQDQPTYTVVSIQGNSLVINAYKQDGNLLDSYVIEKKVSSCICEHKIIKSEENQL